MPPVEMTTEVEMKEVSSPTTEMEVEVSKKDVDSTAVDGIVSFFGILDFFILVSMFIVFADIREQLRQIEKSVLTKEPRFVFRVLRSLPNTRRRLNSTVLRQIIQNSYLYSPKERDNLLNIVGGEDVAEMASPQQRGRGKQGSVSPLPEVLF